LRKDLRTKKWTITRYSTNDFVAALAEHVPDRYRHAIRYFGLLSPRTKGTTSAALFELLGQRKRPRPRRLRWAESIQKDFGRNPLIDSRGQRMQWVNRFRPEMKERAA
jgi:hypothetical protein